MQLKNVTPIITAILQERDAIPLLVVRDRYLANREPNKHGNAMRGGLRKALRIIEQAPVVDAVEVVRCKNCWKRGCVPECPMCYQRESFSDVYGYVYETINMTTDDGFCSEGEESR